MGEFIGIRFGRVPQNTDSVKWEYRPHTEFDGIGGLVDILRKSGEQITELPKITHPASTNVIRTGLISCQPILPRKKLFWSQDFIDRAAPDSKQCDADRPASCVAWHVFSEQETREIVRYARLIDVTVNTVLIRLLDKAIRPDLRAKTANIPWMIPVNLRGRVDPVADTGNCSSAVMIHTHPRYRFEHTHAHIYNKLQRGEHLSVWRLYGLTKNLPHKVKAELIDKDRAMPQWNIGSFSNLGVWDQEKRYEDRGDLIFMPPTLRCQWIGAGCVTYQRKLSLAIQLHPDIATKPAVAQTWMQRWVKEIAISLPQTNGARK